MRASAILTYRGGRGDEGRGNLDAVLRRLARERDLETIVVEEDTCPRLAASPAHPDARIVFAYRDGPLLEGWGRNVGARHAAGEVLLFGDARTIVPSGFAAAVAQCSRYGQVVKPHGPIVELTPGESECLRDRGPDEELSFAGGIRTRARTADDPLPLCSGWFGIRRDAFLAIGAFDERFADAGALDESMSMKVERARLSTCEIDERPALRLDGPCPRGAASGHANGAQDRALLDDYARYDDASLERLIAVQRQVHGRRDKYVPDER